MFLFSVQISDIMEWHKSDLLECIFLMPCTVVVLPDNNLTRASGTFRYSFRENVAVRRSLALIWYYITFRLDAQLVQVLLQTAPHSKLLGSNEISIISSPFVILFLEQLILLQHHWRSFIDCWDKIIITS